VTGLRPLAVAVAATAVAATASFFVSVEDPSPRPEAVCEWLAGDLDVHTAYTFINLRYMLLDQALTFAYGVQEQADLASERGLDFLAITDYDDLTAQDAPGYGTNGLIWIPAYEHPFAGVAQLLGATEHYPGGDASASAVKTVASRLRESGGVLQVGHPGDRRWPRAYGTRIEPDSVEVWFNGPWAYDPRKIGKDPEYSIAFFDRLLDQGYRVAATAGSNSQFRATSKLAGIGQPTTWVCAEDRSAAGVLEGIAAGRTSVSHEYPSQSTLTEGESGSSGGEQGGLGASGKGGFRNAPPADTDIPFVSIEADGQGGEASQALMGDAVSPGQAIRVGVFDAPFSILRLIGDGSRVLDQVEVFSPTFIHEFDAPPDVSWVRAEVFARPEDTIGGPCDLTAKVASYCGNRIGMLALSSPIFISDPVDDE
jgi:hypothetical protein